MEMDGSEVQQLALDLSRAPLRIQLGAAKVVRRGAQAIDAQMTIDATGHMGNWFGIPGTSYATPLEKHVSHEMVGPLEAEIGIENKGAGRLAEIIAFGTPRNAPAYDPYAGPRRLLPKIADMLAEAGEDATLGEKGAGQ